jgi:hypothetical protein
LMRLRSLLKKPQAMMFAPTLQTRRRYERREKRIAR